MAPSFEPSPLPGERRTGTVAGHRAVPSNTKHIHLTTNSFQVTRDLPPTPSSLPGWGRGRRCPIRAHHQTQYKHNEGLAGAKSRESQSDREKEREIVSITTGGSVMVRSPPLPPHLQ